jgi:hypothetical protein
MKKIAALGAVAAIALTATVAATAGADAKQWHPMYPQHHYYPQPHGGIYFSMPFFGMQIGPRYPYRYHSSARSLHVQWCASHYKTYNPYTNTFFIKKGVPAVCVSPYSQGW